MTSKSEMWNLTVALACSFSTDNCLVPASCSIYWPSWLQQFFPPQWGQCFQTNSRSKLCISSSVLSCVCLFNIILVNSYGFSLFFSCPYVHFPICVSILMLLCSLNTSPTYTCFALINLDALCLILFLYPFFPSTYTLPCLPVAGERRLGSSTPTHWHSWMQEHCLLELAWYSPSWGCVLQGYVNRNAEDVPGDLEPSTGREERH